MLVLNLGKTVKDSIQKQGMLAWQYNTIGVSDAITMGGEGKDQRHIIPISVLTFHRYAVFSSDKRDYCRQYRDCHVRTAP